MKLWEAVNKIVIYAQNYTVGEKKKHSDQCMQTRTILPVKTT